MVESGSQQVDLCGHNRQLRSDKQADLGLETAKRRHYNCSTEDSTPAAEGHSSYRGLGHVIADWNDTEAVMLVGTACRDHRSRYNTADLPECPMLRAWGVSPLPPYRTRRIPSSGVGRPWFRDRKVYAPVVRAATNA